MVIQLHVAIDNLANRGVVWALELQQELARMDRDGWEYTVVDPLEGPYKVKFSGHQE